MYTGVLYGASIFVYLFQQQYSIIRITVFKSKMQLSHNTEMIENIHRVCWKSHVHRLPCFRKTHNWSCRVSRAAYSQHMTDSTVMN